MARLGKAPKIQRISLKSWESGTVTAFDDRRTPIKGLRSSGNLILEQDGTVRPRPSTTEYGPQPVGKVLGEIFEFRRMVGTVTTNWMCSLQNKDGVTKLYIAKGEDSTWTEVSGKTYHATARGHFAQINEKVVVMNGEDTLSFLDTQTSVITAFTQIAAPGAPTLNANVGLTGTSFKVYYAVTANSSVGETEGSPVLAVQVSADRDMWNKDTQGIKINYTLPVGAKSANIYMGISIDGAGDPTLYCIAAGVDPTITTFMDNGTRGKDETRPLPKYNSTAGPRTMRAHVINGRVWMVGDKEKPFYVWRGGDYGHELDFSPSFGGGFSSIGSGTKEIPIAVKPYRDGKGDPRITVFSQGTNGLGKRNLLSPETLTYGDASFVVWKVEEDTGQDSTDGADSLVIHNNSLWFVSRDGVKTTGTIPQLQNVLSTNRVSNTIQDAIPNLNTAAMDLSVGCVYEGRIYWSLPVSSSKNSQMWVLDVERGGAWMKPWNLAADWLWLYNDNNGKTHFLALVNNRIIEFSYYKKTTDTDKAFRTEAQSGQVLFSDDGRDWGRLIQIIFTVLRPIGGVNFIISGLTEDGMYSDVVSKQFGSDATRSGWGEPRAGWSHRKKWGKTRTVPKVVTPATVDVAIEVDEDFQWFQYGWNSTQSGVDYSMSNVVAEYVNVGTKDLE